MPQNIQFANPDATEHTVCILPGTLLVIEWACRHICMKILLIRTITIIHPPMAMQRMA